MICSSHRIGFHGDIYSLGNVELREASHSYMFATTGELERKQKFAIWQACGNEHALTGIVSCGVGGSFAVILVSFVEDINKIPPTR